MTREGVEKMWCGTESETRLYITWERRQTRGDIQRTRVCERERVYLNIKAYETQTALISVRYHKHRRQIFKTEIHTDIHQSACERESFGPDGFSCLAWLTTRHSSGVIDPKMLKWKYHHNILGKLCIRYLLRALGQISVQWKFIVRFWGFLEAYMSLLQNYETSCKVSLQIRLHKLTKSVLFLSSCLWTASVSSSLLLPLPHICLAVC